MAATLADASRALWAHLSGWLGLDVVRSGRRGDGTFVSGTIAPGAWVSPVLVGVLFYGFVVDLIATGLCFSCAAAGRTWWPPIALALLAAWGRRFSVRVRDDGTVTATKTFFGLPYARVRGTEARVSELPAGPGVTRGVSLSVEGAGRAPWLVGSQRSAKELVSELSRAVRSTT